MGRHTFRILVASLAALFPAPLPADGPSPDPSDAQHPIRDDWAMLEGNWRSEVVHVPGNVDVVLWLRFSPGDDHKKLTMFVTFPKDRANGHEYYPPVWVNEKTFSARVEPKESGGVLKLLGSESWISLNYLQGKNHLDLTSQEDLIFCGEGLCFPFHQSKTLRLIKQGIWSR